MTNKELYIQQINRINKFIKQATKRGYVFEEIPELILPKRVSKKTLDKITSLNPNKLYARSSFYDTELKQTISGDKERKLIRSRAAKKGKERINQESNIKADNLPSESYEVLQNLRELINNWQPLPHWDKRYIKLKQNDKNILNNILNGAVASLGEKQVAKNIQENAALIKDLAFHICYGSSDFKWGDIQGDIAAIAAIIRGRTLTIDESKEIQPSIDETYNYEES